MKITKKIILMVAVSALLFCCSCGLFGDKEYFCEIETVESIQIVELGDVVEGEYRYEYTVLAEIEDRDAFVQRLNAVKHSVNWGDPGVLSSSYVVIKINYLNGDYDLLYRNAQQFNRSGANQSGYFFFDEKQFNALISDYIQIA